MLTVIKMVLPMGKWVAEPELLVLMHGAGLSDATSAQFTAFYRSNPVLLDSMMAGAGAGAKGYDCIFVNKSRYMGKTEVRHYYLLPKPTATLRWATPAAQPVMREGRKRRQVVLTDVLISAFNAEYIQPTAHPSISAAAAQPKAAPTEHPPKAQRRIRSSSPRLSSTAASSALRFGDRYVCTLRAFVGRPVLTHFVAGTPQGWQIWAFGERLCAMPRQLVQHFSTALSARPGFKRNVQASSRRGDGEKVATGISTP